MFSSVQKKSRKTAFLAGATPVFDCSQSRKTAPKIVGAVSVKGSVPWKRHLPPKERSCEPNVMVPVPRQSADGLNLTSRTSVRHSLMKRLGLWLRSEALGGHPIKCASNERKPWNQDDDWRQLEVDETRRPGTKSPKLVR